MDKKRKKWLCVLGLFRIMGGWLGVRFNDAKPKLCEVASAVFSGVGFCFVGWCSSLIFAFSIEKNKLIKSKKQCAASGLIQKL